MTFAEMRRQFPGNSEAAITRLKSTPVTRSADQKPLRGALGRRLIEGVELEQWQYDISSGARLWYCVDHDRRIIWLTLAAMGHPRATTARGKRPPRGR